MTVTTRRGSETGNDRDLERRVADLEALIKEARRRARRRRSVHAAIVLTALGAAAWASFDVGGDGGVSVGRSASSGAPAASATQSRATRWRRLNGPQGGTLFALAIDPADSRILYAAGWGRVFKSTNGGEGWKDVSRYEPWQEIESLAIDPLHPRVVYVGSDRGIGKTVDGGRHWRMVNRGLFDHRPLPPRTAPPNGAAAGLLAIDPQHPAVVYATTGLGLYRTRNGGARWRTIGPLPFRNAICRRCVVTSSGYAMSFAIDPTNARALYASWTGHRNGAPAPSNFFESSDGGDSWRRITMATPLSFSALAVTASGALVATDMSRPGVFRSTDGGATWSPAGLAGETVYALDVDPGSGAIYATTRSGAVFRTSDGGESWQTAPTNLAWVGTVTDPSDPATVYATADSGLLKSVDHGQTWAAADKGIVSQLISALALAPGDPATLYTASGASVFRSTDRGRSWHAETTGLGGASVTTLAVAPHHPRTIFAGTRDGLFTSGDGGRWTRVPTGFPVVQAVGVDPQHPRTVYVGVCHGGCGGPGSFLKTVDGGTTWRQITIGSYENGAGRWRKGSVIQSLAIDPAKGSTVFAGTTRGGIFRSTDAGTSWQPVATARGNRRSHLGFPGAVIAIAIDPLDPDTIYAASRTGGIRKSADGGTTWATANTGLTNLDMDALAVDPHDPQILFASTQSGVFRSDNGGKSWRPYDRGLPAGGVAAFAIDPAGRTAYAGTQGDGVDALTLGG